MGGCIVGPKSPPKESSAITMSEKDKVIQMLMRRRKNLGQKIFMEPKCPGSDRKDERYSIERNAEDEGSSPERKCLETIPSFLEIDQADSIDGVTELEFEKEEGRGDEIYIEEGEELFIEDEFKFEKVDVVDDYPFNGVGRVEVFGEDSFHKNAWKLTSTGTLIAPDLVITCSHGFVNKEKVTGKKCWFVFYRQGKVEQYKVKKVMNFSEMFISGHPNRYQYDLTLLKLQEKVDFLHGYMGCDFSENNISEDDAVLIAGYGKNKKVLSYSEARIKEIYQGNFLFHNGNTLEGVSGASLLKKDKEKNFYVVGIHIGYNGNRKLNLALYFNEKVRKTLSELLREDEVELNLNEQQFDEEEKQLLQSSKAFNLVREENMQIGVTHLNISHHQITEKHLNVLFPQNESWNLKVLHLANVGIKDQHLKYVHKHRQLKQLDLSGNQITHKGIAELPPFLPNMQSLNLSNMPLTSIIFEFLFRFQNLQTLIVRNCAISPNQSQVFFNKQQFQTAEYPQKYKKLRHIDLSENSIGIAGIRTLTLLRDLVRIALNKCSLGSEGLKELCSGQFERIKELHLNNNNLSGEGIQQLNRYYTLTHLDLGSNSLKNDGMAIIAKFKFSLLSLNVSNNQLTDDSLNNLSDKFIRHLESLDISQNEISDEGLGAMSKHKFESLQQLNLDKTKVSSNLVEKLHEFRQTREERKNPQSINVLLEA